MANAIGMTGQRWWHPVPWTFLALWLLLMIVGPSRLFRDPGTFWHTRVGQLLWQHGFFRHDPFTFTFADQPWIPHQWLGELIMAGLYGLGGFDLQLWVTATLLAGLFAHFARRLLEVGWHPLAMAMLLTLSVAAAGTHFHVRPHLLTIVGMAWVTQWLMDVETGRIPLHRLGWLIPLLLLWANGHGGALGGWGTVLLVSGGWIGMQLLGGATPLRHRYDGVILLLVLLVPVGLIGINPYGWDLVQAWLTILDEPLLRSFIEEHRPLAWDDPGAWPVFLLMAGYLALLVGLPVSAWRVSWFIPLVWAIQAVERCRHAALFVVVLLPVVSAVWPRTRWAGWLQHRRPDWFCQGRAVPPCSLHAWAVPIGVVLLSLGLQLAQVSLPPLGTAGTIPPAHEWPVGLLPLLQEHQSIGSLIMTDTSEECSGSTIMDRPRRLFNDYRDGGFVIFFAPGYRVFVDDRCELFGGAWLQEFVQAASTDEAAMAAIPAWEKRYGPFEYALVRQQTPWANYFATHRQDWQELGRDAVAILYRRRP
ncbi:MAG: hypothetical protein NZU63_14240 [Gemmataceae bacterium]|nr:hypothetical protein [Gemmataceae bacterium]